MNERGVSQVEMVLSFVIFIGFTIFLLAAFPVFKSEKSTTGLDAAERGVLSSADMNLTYFTIITNKTRAGCFYIPLDSLGMGGVQKVIVRDIIVDGLWNGTAKSGNIYLKRTTGQSYQIFSSAYFEERTFDTSLCVDASDSSNGISYGIGITLPVNALSYDRLVNLSMMYNSSYNSLKSQFDVPNKEDFGFTFSDLKGNPIVSAMKIPGRGRDVLSKSTPMQMYHKNGTGVFGMLNIQSW